jgi:hypothetical protein
MFLQWRGLFNFRINRRDAEKEKAKVKRQKAKTGFNFCLLPYKNSASPRLCG